MKSLLFFILIFVGIGPLSGVGGKARSQAVIGEASFELLGSGSYSNYTAEETLVIREKNINEVIRSLRVRELSIDFAKESAVILIAAGQKPTGGWQIEVLKAEETASECWVYYTITPPQKRVVLFNPSLSHTLFFKVESEKSIRFIQVAEEGSGTATAIR